MTSYTYIVTYRVFNHVSGVYDVMQEFYHEQEQHAQLCRTISGEGRRRGDETPFCSKAVALGFPELPQTLELANYLRLCRDSYQQLTLRVQGPKYKASTQITTIPNAEAIDTQYSGPLDP